MHKWKFALTHLLGILDRLRLVKSKETEWIRQSVEWISEHYEPIINREPLIVLLQLQKGERSEIKIRDEVYAHYTDVELE